MLTVDKDEVDEFSEYLKPVQSFDSGDIETLLDCWNHAITEEDLLWSDVIQVLEGTDGFYYFSVSKNANSGFNIFDFIAELGGPVMNTLNARQRSGGGSRGVPGQPIMARKNKEAQEPSNHPTGNLEEGIVIGNVDSDPGQEDYEATSVFDEDDDDFLGDNSARFYLDVMRTGKSFSLETGNKLTVGRSSTAADVQILGNKRISRTHAKFEVVGTSLYVEDLGSSNKTFVEGIEVHEKTEVRPGEKVSLGGEIINVGN